jgi:hypothetical protein
MTTPLGKTVFGVTVWPGPREGRVLAWGGPADHVHLRASAQRAVDQFLRDQRRDLIAREAEVVVTFDPRPVIGPGAIDGLRRMSLDAAHKLVADARPRRGRIVRVETLEVIGGER